MTLEDKRVLEKFKIMRETLSHHHPGDDCPYGAPYGGYTVRDTRREITAKTKFIKTYGKD